MLTHIILSLTVSLTLTLIIELSFALAMRVRGRDLLLVTLVNVLTNPIVVSVSLFVMPMLIIPLEIAAVLTEAFFYHRYADNIKRPFVFSLSANLISYTFGLILSLF